VVPHRDLVGQGVNGVVEPSARGSKDTIGSIEDCRHT